VFIQAAQSKEQDQRMIQVAAAETNFWPDAGSRQMVVARRRTIHSMLIPFKFCNTVWRVSAASSSAPKPVVNGQ
jgi:hypothetical protein